MSFFDRVNDARWAAANVRHEGDPPTMEAASEMAEEAIRAFLGFSKEAWTQIMEDVER